MKRLFIMLLFLSTKIAYAEIFECKNDNGIISYQSAPCKLDKPKVTAPNINETLEPQQENLSTIAVAREPITLSNDDYLINIPSDWIEIPNNVLQKSQQDANKVTGQNQTYEHGYQLANAKTWLQCPYVLVQIRRNGRENENQFKQYKIFNSEFKGADQKNENNTGDLLTNMVQGETLYDESIHILWTNVNMDIKGIGKVTTLSALKLTEYGYILFMGFALEKEFSQYQPVFRQMVNSITISDQDVYKPKNTDDTPIFFGINWKNTAISAITAGLIGLIIASFKWFKRKQKIRLKIDNSN